jgi:hypothetical protein
VHHQHTAIPDLHSIKVTYSKLLHSIKGLQGLGSPSCWWQQRGTDSLSLNAVLLAA